MGQHFLKSRSGLRKIAAAIGARAGQTIVEIGAGHGELTGEITNEDLNGENARQPPRLIAIERDARLAEGLRNMFAGDARIDVVEGDALEILPNIVRDRKLRAGTWKLVGNIPYYLTGRLLRTVGELAVRPERCVFTVQQEVAERLAAAPPRMNRLAASVQFWAEPRIVARIPRSSFLPRPKVDAAVIVLASRPQLPGTSGVLRSGSSQPDAPGFYRAARILFAQPRKTLRSNLRDALGNVRAQKVLAASGVNGALRPQNLSISDILRIAGQLDA